MHQSTIVQQKKYHKYLDSRIFYSNRWECREAHLLSENNLRSLLDNEIPVIYIPGFATEKECAAFIGGCGICWI